MMTTTHTRTTTSSGDHHELPPPPPSSPPSSPTLPPPLPSKRTMNQCDELDLKEPTPSSISTSPTSSHEDLSPPTPPPPPPSDQPLSTIHGTTSAPNYTTTTTPSNKNTATPPSPNSPNRYRTPPQYTRKTSTSTTATATSSTTADKDNEYVDLIELASITLASTIIASKIIQKHSTLLSTSSNNNTTNNNDPNSKTQPCQNHKSRTKTDGSIVTDADGESQRIITSYIHSISTSIRIVGEESNEDIQISQKGFHRKTWFGISPGSKRKLISKEKESEDYIVKLCQMELGRRSYKGRSSSHRGSRVRRGNSNTRQNQSFEHQKDVLQNIDLHHVNTNRISIYVDPLDGTSAYAKGQYEAVTILAGIMLDNVPIFGIIVKPFGHEGCNVNFDMNMGIYANNEMVVSSSSDLSSSSSSSTQGGGRSSCVVSCQSYFCPHQHQQQQQQQQEQQDTNSHLGFHYPCSVLYGGLLLGGAFMFSGDELTRSRIHRTKQQSSTNPTIVSLDRDRKETQILNSSSSESFKVDEPLPSTSLCNDQQRKAIISKSRGGGVVKQCINSLSSKGLLHPEPIFITGAGYKTMRLLLGTNNETMWFFPKPGTSLWDVAAADALLRVMGGRLSDKYGDDLDYSRSWTDADNLDGIVACSDVDLHAKCIELYHDECWDDED